MTKNLLLPRLEQNKANKLRKNLLQGGQNTVFSPASLSEAMQDPKAFPATGAVRVQEAELIRFREECLSELDAVLSEVDDFALAFDLAVGRKIHVFSDSTGAEMGIAAVWDFLTLVLLPDLVVRRLQSSRDDLSESESNRSRLTGGDRRHVLQRLWKRWEVFGAPIVESCKLTEDDYGSMLERKLTREHRLIAREVAEAIVSSELAGSARREYTRAMMRKLVQMTGLVQFSDADLIHVKDAIVHAHHSVSPASAELPIVDLALPAREITATARVRTR